MFTTRDNLDGSATSPKPAILCLHGGGTNSDIFNIQTIRIQLALQKLEFVFINAPFVAEPGPGVLPVFDGLEPYLRWVSKGEEDKPTKTKALLEKVIEQQRRKDGRGFVGVLGFSQGARVAAGLLLEQQLRQREGLFNDDDAAGFGFGVFLNGTCPPLTANLSTMEKEERISVPSLHVVGKDDEWREQGETLFARHFDPEKAMLLEFNVGHRLPIVDEDTAQVAREIWRMYCETSGQKKMNLAAVEA